MDIKQEVSEIYKVEMHNEMDDGFLTNCKIEIREEFKKESVHDTFVYSDSQQFSTKIEVKEDESKLKPIEEIATNNENGSPDRTYSADWWVIHLLLF
ncbi:uncharacterized protein LOC126880284 isoform X2 [Diabrotica virgifera virgifera]|uniref:Uncharacterized protein n=1 Tax=Diabrotica virgifera virgifera TaxID=50390 RepID=A0ABM5JPZ2_DIAVI|nr:uncharacterized protein LOC126880284 isoform X2 [Diabrotica virgifera virgifera]